LAGGIEVSAPSHVHAGNFDLHGGLGRLYGTVGFTLEEPRLLLRAERASEGVEVRGERREEARAFLEKAAAASGCGVSGWRITVERAIPAHVGLGSTTALALSVAYSVRELCGSRASLEELALRMGRGIPSALGFYGFTLGGFIVDGGFKPGSMRIPPLIFRVHVPRSIVIVVALPEKPIPKVLEVKRRESEVLARMPRMPESMAERASRIILAGVLPAAAEGDWAEAARLLHRFNRMLGEYWAAEQGGVYCCPETEELIDAMVKAGAWGGLQSSWGPTAYAIAPRRRAREVEAEARKALERIGGGMVWSTHVDNEGARARRL
jgi:beta-ribofuranosylaminobenzene 5'-phosphate synthase